MGEALHICMTIIDNVSKSTCQGGYLAGTRLSFAMMKIKDLSIHSNLLLFQSLQLLPIWNLCFVCWFDDKLVVCRQRQL
jgi:hypothetical protein